MFKIHLYFIACALIIIFTQKVGAEVFINKKYGIILPPISADIGAKEFKWFILSTKNDNNAEPENYEITITVGSLYPAISAYICDEPNLELLVNGQNAHCLGTKKGKKTFKIEAHRYSNHPHYLVFYNGYSLLTKKPITANIYITQIMPDVFVQEMKKGFMDTVKEMHDYFKVPEFDITLAQCRSENAFSTTKGGHITICSELLFGAILDNNKGAFISVFLHELGHTFLNLWELPNYSNERTADEFAVAFLLMTQNNIGEEFLYDWIDWFRQREFLEGEIVAMLSGDQHPLTAQRIALIEKILASQGDFQRRWANILYPHMTDTALEEIIENPYAGANIELAERILDTRK